jgi:hypothetical protein
MSMHTEWDTAIECAVTILEGSDVVAPGDPITAPYVLFLGGEGGGCLAVEGTAEELRAFAARVAAEVAAL